MFTQIDWDNDLSYEVIGVNLKNSTKNISPIELTAIIMHYNEKLGKWQVTGTIGGFI